ncbi:MAG: hypothetical protein WC614_11570 [bacterium]
MENNKRYLELKGKKAEEMLYNLAQKTFLTDWCYLNPKLPDNKELCDLLIVFDNIAIIWQVKDLKIDSDGKYNQSEVKKNLRQLSGAKRQLFDLKTSIQLANPKRGKEDFNPKEIKEIYLISLLMGQQEVFYCPIDTVKKLIVPTFNKESIKIILNELDTISDFCKYLKQREKLFTRKNFELVVSGGEKELLAYYLMNEYNFDSWDKCTGVFLEEGCWNALKDKPEYKLKQEENKISYGWDSMIDRAHESNNPEYEKIAREMAKLSRFERRILAKSFLEIALKAHKDIENNVFRRVQNILGVTYAFLFIDDKTPITQREEALRTFCYVCRGTFKDNRKVIGIATEKGIKPTCSYCFGLLDMPEWTEENELQMKRIQKDTGILTNPNWKQFQENEYPKIS